SGKPQEFAAVPSGRFDRPCCRTRIIPSDAHYFLSEQDWYQRKGDQCEQPSPMKCQMNIAETANLGITRSQPARDSLATMTVINPAIIATIKIETKTRPIP